MSVVIYMPLEDEGTDYWRPVHADHVLGEVYEITVLKEPGEEHWRFPPGSTVRCREHVFQDGERGLVAYELVSGAGNLGPGFTGREPITDNR